ncbi:MAG: hypothetical protein H0T43_09205, partial [Solirubrobacterales bacterium]|nr:hypothetical protein [Solirubrobacterales bacterium]
ARWKAGDAERNERARIERLRRAGARTPSENLAEGIALIRFAHGAQFSASARIRRCTTYRPARGSTSSTSGTMCT